MSINGINNPLLTNIGPLNRPSDASRTQTSGVPARASDANAANAARAALKPQTPIAGQATPQNAVPVDAPSGTDPELWSVLTNDERSFFAKTASLGPLTYGRMKAAATSAPPAMRGGRLDVKA